LIEVPQESGRWRRALIAATIALPMLAGASPAAAEEGLTRDEYVTQLEAVCKPDAIATQQAMKGVRTDVSADRIGVAAGKFAKATRIFGSTVREITTAPRPSADAAKLDKWFTYLDRQESYLQQITTELRADHRIKAQRLTARFIHNGNLANNVVLAFGFDYCSFKFSRFG
jgi:hypothetical protein